MMGTLQQYDIRLPYFKLTNHLEYLGLCECVCVNVCMSKNAEHAYWPNLVSLFRVTSRLTLIFYFIMERNTSLPCFTDF